MEIRLRTREGMAVARAKGKLRGKSPKLSDKQQKELRRMHDTGDYSISDLAEVLLSQGQPSIERWAAKAPPHNDQDQRRMSAYCRIEAIPL